MAKSSRNVAGPVLFFTLSWREKLNHNEAGGSKYELMGFCCGGICPSLCKRVMIMSLSSYLAPSWARFSRVGVLSRVCRHQQSPELRVQPQSHKFNDPLQWIICIS